MISNATVGSVIRVPYPYGCRIWIDDKQILYIDSYKKYIDMKGVLNKNTNGGGDISTMKICVTNINGRPIGVGHNKPLLYSQ